MTEYKFQLKITEDEFIEKCESGRCLRQTIKSKQCEKESKQIQCYKKYVLKKEKDWKKDHEEKDYEWEQLRSEILLRDGSCLAIKCLTIQELVQVEKKDGFWLSQKFIGDGAHIVSRAQSPKNIYNRNNVVILSRYFHQLLDNGLDLITGEYIGFEGSKRWWERILRSAGMWSSEYTYDDFYKEITGEGK